MKFNYINDVHLDFWVGFNLNQLKYEKRTREFAKKLLPIDIAETLIIGGDLGHYNIQNYWLLDELSKTYKNILLVFGNHDYYLLTSNQSKKYKRNSFNRTKEMISLTNGLTGIKYLEGDIIELNGVVFGGTGMWYDFQYGQQKYGYSYEDVRVLWANNSNDFRYIKALDNKYHFSKEADNLKRIIVDSDIIISHVGPDWELCPYKNKLEVYNSFYFFDGDDLLNKYSGKTWCFGHIHTELDIEKNGNRFISYALGYPDESGFKKIKSIEI